MKQQHIVLLALIMFAIITMSGCNNSSDPVTPPAGNLPGTIAIGSQVWADKNLDVSTYRNGDPIPQVQDSIAWSNLTTGAWCYYNGDAGLGATYGKIYNWYAVNDSRGLAPLGYHVASDAEWTTLTNYLGGDTIAGGKLKALTLWENPNIGATNSSGFTALPAGFRNNIGNSYFITYDGYFWTANEDNVAQAWNRYLFNMRADINRYSIDKRFGYSVRCIKD